jgi:hypothetical protein
VPILAIAAVLGIALFATNAFAQSGAGSIQGTVTDATGAVIPGATIHVVNVATGVATDTKADKVGFYQAPELFAGTYRVSATAPGMETYTTSIDLLVAQAAVINPVLTAGAVTQQVVVTGNMVQLTTTDNGTINSTLERSRIDQLPENGRFLNNLVQMSTPGLEGIGGTAAERANGMLMNGLEYRIDGTATSNLHAGGENNNKVQLLDPDSVQAVQVNITNSGAEYSTAATAIITTKSGTNRLHGSAFETARNNATGIAKNRSDLYNLVAPEYIRNEFGASAGGPIILPHVYHGKDKSFWFFSYERYSLAQNSDTPYTVPTAAMRQGNYNGSVNGAGVLQVLYDPSTTTANAKCPVPIPGATFTYTTTSNNPYCRTPFSNNTIPIGEESPTAALLYQTMQLPTSSNSPLVTTNLTAANNAFQVTPQFTFRLDHVFNENNRTYVRFSDEWSPVHTDTNGSPTSVAATGLPAGATEGYENNPLQDFMAGIGYTHVFSPTFYSETVVNEQWLAINDWDGADPLGHYEAALGMPNNFGEPGFPTVSGLMDSLVSSQTQTLYTQLIWNADENLTKINGKHQLRFGGHWQHYRDAEQPAGLADAISFGANPTGLYNSSTGANYTDTSNAGIDDASFFLGSPGSLTVYIPSPHAHYHWDDIDAYIQDDFHKSENLTVNVGLRWEARPGAWIKGGLNNTIDFKTGAIVTSGTPATLIAEGFTTQAVISSMQNIGVVFETPAQAHMPSNLERNYDLNLLPRVGFAYRLFNGRPGTVVRGSFGRFTQRSDTENYLNHAVKNDPLVDDWVQSYSTAAQAVDALPNELLRYNDPVKFGSLGSTTNGLANVVNTAGTNSITPGITQWADDPNWAPVFVSLTNFTVEQPFKGNSVLRVSYVWNHSSNLDIAHDFNQNPTNYQWEMAKGIVPPTGGASVIGTPQQNTYSTTALGPYNQTIYGSGSSYHTKTGWMNDNELQVNYQRLFHHGFAYQIYYVFSKDLRAGGDASGHTDAVASATAPYADYPGGEGTVATMNPIYGPIGFAWTAPTPPVNVTNWQDYKALNHYELYSLDDGLPIHHIQFNGILDLPIGRGKWLLGNANKLVNEIIGGYQIAGNGSVTNQVFRGPTQNWGAESPIKIYKHKYPIVDCTSGNCYKEFLWNNGYLAPSKTQGVAGSTCLTNCITGLPADYVPDQTPIDNVPGTTYYQDNEVQISAPGLGSSPQNIVYDGGPTGAHLGAHTFLNGPMAWNADASIFKVFPIKDGVNLRVNMDVFNVFNYQGYNTPNATSGVEEVQPGGASGASSNNAVRQVQITARLSF